MAVERGDDSLHAVLEIGRLAGSIVPLDQGLPPMLEAIGRAFAAAAVVLREHHADATLCVRAAWGDPGGATEWIDRRDDAAARCAADGVPLIARAPDDAATAAMHAPLLAHDRTAAVLSVYRRDGSDRPWSVRRRHAHTWRLSTPLAALSPPAWRSPMSSTRLPPQPNASCTTIA